MHKLIRTYGAELAAAAVHEIGHVALNRHGGMPVLKVTVTIHDDGFVAGNTETWKDPQDLHLDAFLIACFGGYLAEAAFRRRNGLPNMPNNVRKNDIKAFKRNKSTSQLTEPKAEKLAMTIVERERKWIEKKAAVLAEKKILRPKDLR